MERTESLRLTEESQRWLVILGSAAAIQMPPLAWRVLPHSERPGRRLPLWLEPEIDYGAGVVYTARDPDGRLPTRGMRAHETVHWALEHLRSPSPRRLGLEGLCDAGAALLTNDPVIASTVPALTRDLRRPAFDASADLSTRALVTRILTALEHAEGIRPRVLASVRHELTRASADDVHVHQFGIPFGAWLWQVLSAVPIGPALTTLLGASSVSQPTPAAAVRAVLDALPANARQPAAAAADGFGLPKGGDGG
jgi:hypothetical protein